MIFTWLADVTPLLEQERYLQYFRELPAERKAKAETLKQPLSRAQSVGAGTLLRRMKEKYGLGEGGSYNLSHSGIYALCSVAEEEAGERRIAVGCDVEMLGEFREKVARRFFTTREQAQIFGAATEWERTDWFYRYWVLKESFIKATRKGMGLDLRSFEIQFQGEEPLLTRQPEEYGQSYYYKEYEPPGRDAKLAVCSNLGEFGELWIEEL